MMITRDALRELFNCMEWADAKVWGAALACEPAVRDQKLLGWLLHIHVVQRAFLHVWTGKPVAFPQPSEFEDIVAVHRWSQSYYDEARQFLATLDDAAMGRSFEMPWAKQFAAQLEMTFEATTLADTLFQVTSHSTYHRGQVNARIRELGGVPPLVDYIAWVWFGKPAAEHPATEQGPA